MKEFFYQLLRLPGVFKRIELLPFGADLRRGLRRTHISTTFLRRRGYPGKLAALAGCPVRYCHFDTFVYLFREIFLDGEYYFNSGSAKPFILDCGSNIGMSIMYFKARHPGAEIIGFEPDDEAFACLQENVTANGFRDVSINKKAVSGQEGEIYFWRAAEKPGALGNTICSNQQKDRVSVNSVLLSGYVDRTVDFLKLDVEGAELEVLKDLAETGKLRMVRQMFVEYHLHIAGENDVLSKMLHILEVAGFGYQIGGKLERPLKGGQFQGLSIYAYNKSARL